MKIVEAGRSGIVEVCDLDKYRVVGEISGTIVRENKRYVLRIGGMYYAPILYSEKDDILVVEALRDYYPTDMCSSGNNPICPLCGRVLAYTEEHFSYPCICRSCGAEIGVEREVKIRYKTSVVKKPDVIDLGGENAEY
jgi:hypothetical protein